MLSLFLLSCLTLTNGLTKKHALLNTETPLPSNGASIALNPQSTTALDSDYDVHVHFQDAYDIKLSLDDSWGFESRTISALTLTMHGITPYPQYPADVILIFSVDDVQYFSFFFHLDTDHTNSKIYPSVSMHKNTQKVSEWLFDTQTIQQRTDRVSNNNSWIPLQQWDEQSLWPLKFVITNNPKSQHSTFEFYHNTTDSFALGYAFNASFVPHKPMDIYLLGQSTLEMFSVSSFDVLLTNHSTAFPTTAPTQHPTDTTASPTRRTVQPTRAPTNRLYPRFTNTIPDTNRAHTHDPRKHKSQAITIVVVLLLSVIAFFGVVFVCRKCCKPVNNRSKDEDEMEISYRTDSESLEKHDRYMNEGPLEQTRFRIPTQSVTSSIDGIQIRHSSFLRNMTMDMSPQFSSQSTLQSLPSMSDTIEDTVIYQ